MTKGFCGADLKAILMDTEQESATEVVWRQPEDSSRRAAAYH